MSPNETKALTALAERYSEDFGYLRFATIAAESGLDPSLVRRTVRSLARKGLAEYSNGLWTDDGTPAGAGYRATKAGLHIYWNEINPTPAVALHDHGSTE
jgi:hypothetical protein